MTTPDPSVDPEASKKMGDQSEVAIEQARELIEKSKIVVAQSRATVRSVRPPSDAGTEQ